MKQVGVCTVHVVGMTGDEGGRSVHCPCGWDDW